MRVRFLITAGYFVAGEIVEMAPRFAKIWIAAGIVAEASDDPAPATPCTTVH